MANCFKYPDIGGKGSMAPWSGGRSELISHFNSIPVTISGVRRRFGNFVLAYLTFLNRGGTTHAPRSDPPRLMRNSRPIQDALIRNWYGSKNCPFGESLFVKTGLGGCRRCQCQWRISNNHRGVLSQYKGARPEVDSKGTTSQALIMIYL